MQRLIVSSYLMLKNLPQCFPLSWWPLRQWQCTSTTPLFVHTHSAGAIIYNMKNMCTQVCMYTVSKRKACFYTTASNLLWICPREPWGDVSCALSPLSLSLHHTPVAEQGQWSGWAGTWRWPMDHCVAGRKGSEEWSFQWSLVKNVVMSTLNSNPWQRHWYNDYTP